MKTMRRPGTLAMPTALLTALFGICLHSLGATNVVAIKAGHVLAVPTGRTLLHDGQAMLVVVICQPEQ